MVTFVISDAVREIYRYFLICVQWFLTVSGKEIADVNKAAQQEAWFWRACTPSQGLVCWVLSLE